MLSQWDDAAAEATVARYAGLGVAPDIERIEALTTRKEIFEA